MDQWRRAHRWHDADSTADGPDAAELGNLHCCGRLRRESCESDLAGRADLCSTDRYSARRPVRGLGGSAGRSLQHHQAEPAASRVEVVFVSEARPRGRATHTSVALAYARASDTFDRSNFLPYNFLDESAHRLADTLLHLGIDLAVHQTRP